MMKFCWDGNNQNVKNGMGEQNKQTRKKNPRRHFPCRSDGDDDDDKMNQSSVLRMEPRRNGN